jgi:ankyrin repeat protein
MLLNSSRVDINKQNINGETALIYAIKNLKRSCCFNPDKEEKLIQSLLTKGADVNLQDENGNTALMEAVLLRRKMYCGDAAKESTDIDIKIIRDILSSGKVKLDLKNNLGMTAFDIATRRDPILINHEERRSIPGVIAIFQECVKNLLDQHLISINDPEVKKILPSASKGWLWW